MYGNIQVFAVGIGAGATQTALLNTIVNNQLSNVITWSSAAFLPGDFSFMYRRLCPTTTQVCPCSGFCTCVGSAGCTCPNCNQLDACHPSSCTVPSTGCTQDPGSALNCQGTNPCIVYGTCVDSNGPTIAGGTASCTANSNKVCTSNSICLSPYCDPASGCQTRSVNPCNDLNACTIDTCSNNACVYTPVVCNDLNPCTVDSCVAGTCVYAPITCNDNNVCTSDTCSNGQCIYTPIACDDGNACTTDTCNTATGCSYTPIDCNDNNVCTSDSCSKGVCSHVAIPCNDNDACTTDSCHPTNGCLYTKITCNDNNACTTDSCSNGCKYTPIVCDDGNACTTDTCNIGSGCVYTPIVCNDGNVCTADSCAGGCVYTPIACALCGSGACSSLKTNACQTVGCIESGLVVPDANANSQCTAVSDYSAGYSHSACLTAISTANSKYCFVRDLKCTTSTCSPRACNPVTGTCDGTDLVCNDGNGCTTDTCVNPGGCVYTPIVCTNDKCNTYQCNNGNCDPTPIVCDDGLKCTTDSCSLSSGCVYTPVSCTNDKCNTFSCNNGVCEPTPINCNDNDDCTTDSCSLATGCVNTPITCTGSTTCIDISCSGGGVCTPSPVDIPICKGCQANSCPTTTGACNPNFCFTDCTDNRITNAATCATSLAANGFYCQTVAVVCPGPSVCATFSCNAGECVSTPKACPSANKCEVADCVDTVTGGCTITDPCVGVTIPNLCKEPTCQLSGDINGYTCSPADAPNRDCTDYSCTATNVASSYVVGGKARDQFLSLYAARSPVCTPILCTIDTCDPNTGCLHENLACAPTAQTCNASLGCYESGNPYSFEPGLCQIQVDQSLIDLCGVCFGNFADCFFQSVVPVSTVAGITGGAVAGVVIACIIAAAVFFWLSKKGYDYYRAKSDLSANGLHDNPAFQDHNHQGNMVDN